MPPAAEKLLADLRRAFPRQDVTVETIVVYQRELADVPAAVLEVAVRTVIRASRWFPTVAELREVAAEHMLKLPGEAEALAQIEARMVWARQPESTRGAPPLHPLAQEALDRVGGFHTFRVAEDATVIRGQYGRLYRELRAAAVHAAQVGDLT